MSHHSPFLAPLIYRKSPDQWFGHFASELWSVMLDSHPDCEQAGRYSILTAYPCEILIAEGEGVRLVQGEHSAHLSGDPLAILQNRVDELASELLSPPSHLPFAAGAIGYLSYDYARRLERLPSLAESDLNLPDLAFALYDWAVVVDHQQCRAELVGLSSEPDRRIFYASLLERLSAVPPTRPLGSLTATGPITSNMSESEYASAFLRVQHYILSGDCYQVNLAQRFTVPVQGDPWGGYLALRESSPAPFGAYLNLPWAQVLSFSPERFMLLEGRRVETSPIKGTRPRSSNCMQDRLLAEELINSPKDRAENLMIVDLLRNDLGRCCEPGSIEVSQLFALQSYSNVHHLVSTIRGCLSTKSKATDLLRASLPGGSITGAPKVRAMEIIEELEPQRRSLYCGTIGYLSIDGQMDTNIAIRTLIHSEHKVHFWAGGGIVADSQLEQEYAETFHKASALLSWFGLREGE